YASSQLGAIEINATFYSRQSLKSWEKWRDTAPDEFQFAIKGSRFCVMRGRLSEGAEGIANFFAQGLALLGPKLGPIMWQFAPRRKFDPDDIAGFIDLLPEALDGFAANAREWQKRGDAYVFMINGAKVRAPAAALALQKRLVV